MAKRHGVTELNTNAELNTSALRKLQGILAGTWLAQAVYVATRLGIPDRLAHGPQSTVDLAAGADADKSALRRVLRTLVAAGLLRDVGEDSFGLSSAGAVLCAGAPGGGREMALLQGGQVFRSFAELEHSVRTGQPAFEYVFGQPFYDYLGKDPQTAAAFHEPMAAQPPPAATGALNLAAARTVVDLGGGTGALLAAVLDAYPQLHGTLVELPAAIADATRRLARFDDRASVVSGDIFTAVPPGADAYLLCRVLHNWSDQRCVELLGTIREAARPESRVLVLERLIDPNGSVNLATALGDLLMLATLPGRDRTAAEYGELLTAAGFAVRGVHIGLIEAVPR